MGQIIKTPVTEEQVRETETTAYFEREITRLQEVIGEEIENRKNADSEIGSDLTLEKLTRENADAEIMAALTAETENRTLAINTAKDELNASISNVRQDLNDAVENLETEIQNKDDAQRAATALLNSKLENEITNRTAADANLREDLNNAVTNLNAAIDAESTARSQEIADTQAAIMVSLGDLQAAQSITNTNLRDQIQNQASTQSANLATLNQRLNQEISDRTTEDTNLSSAISNEVTDRQTAITNLQNTLTSLINTKSTATLNSAKSYTDSKFNAISNSLNDFSAPTSSANGKRGLVPAPPAGYEDAVLTAKGWQIIEFTPPVDERIDILFVPYSLVEMIYNGETQTPIWYLYDSTQLEIGGTTSAKNAGTYTVTFTPKSGYKWSDTQDNSPKSVTWTMEKLKLNIPYEVVLSYYYDGTEQEFLLHDFDSTYETISGNKATNVGTYTAIISLKDTNNTVWSDNTTSNKTIEWHMEEVVLSASQSSGFAQVGTLTYTGSNLAPKIQHYDYRIHVLSGTTSAKNAGTYTLKISPQTNMKWNDGTTTAKDVEWKIDPAPLAKPTLENNLLSYTGSNQTVVINGYNSSYMTRSGTITAKAAGDYTVTFALKDTNHVWEDLTTDNVNLDWSISLNKVTPPKWPFTTASYSLNYSGEEQTAPVRNYNEELMTAEGTWKATTVGDYSLTFTLKDASYTWTDGTTAPITLNWKIKALEIKSPSLKYTEYEYNGAEFTPELVYKLSGSILSEYNLTYYQKWCTITGDTSAANVGNYTITLTLKDNVNTYFGGQVAYARVPHDLTWQITRAKLTEEMSSGFEQVGTLTYYLGRTQRPTIQNFDSTYHDITGNSAINAGTYTATITPKENYTWSDGTTTAKNVTWTINRKPIAKPIITTTVHTYDGKYHSATVANWSGREFQRYGDGYVEGTGYVGMILPGDYTCYFTPNDSCEWEDDGATDPIYVDFKILKATVARPAATSTYFVSDGSTKVLEFENYDETLMTLGGVYSAANVGNYTATFTLKKPTCYQFDGLTAATYEIHWEIGGQAIPIPTGSTYQVVTSSKMSWYVVLNGYDVNLMTKANTTNGRDANANGFYFGATVSVVESKVSSWFDDSHTSKIKASTVSLKDKTNYTWSDGTTADKSILVNLEPYALPDYFSTLAQDVTITYDGTAHKWTEGFSAIAGDSDLATNGLFLFCTGGGTKDAATSFTNAGSYEITLTPRNCCTWADGSYGAKTFTFTIEKAEPSFTVTVSDGSTFEVIGGVPAESIYYRTNFTPKKLTRTFTVTSKTGDGIITKTLHKAWNYFFESTFDSTAGKLTLTGIRSYHITAETWEEGETLLDSPDYVARTDIEYSIEIYLSETANYKRSRHFRIVPLKIALRLNDLSWAKIATWARNGTLAENFDVGETKKLTVKGSLGDLSFGSGTELVAVLMGINHNATIEGDKRAHFAVFRTAGSHLTQWEVLSPLNFSEGMTGSDGAAFTFNYDPDNFYSLIDGGPAAYIRECKKYNGREYEIKKIWRMSWYEWRGTTHASWLPSGYSEDYSFQERYDFFAAGNTFQTMTYEGHLYLYFGNWSRSTDGTNYLGLYMGRMYADNPCLQYGFVPCFTV